MYLRKALFVFGRLLLGASVSLAALSVYGSGFPASNSPSEVADSVTLASPEASLTPDIALASYQKHSAEQASRLLSSEDHTVIHAELPDTSQQGDYELVRSYSSAPRSLHYVSVKFTGDGFVRSNVITRVLQSEVEQVEKGDRQSTAINDQNYRFTYKGEEILRGQRVHVYQLKPRHKRAGLFKGKIYLDVATGNLRRMEGSAAKSPSFFVRKIEFVQDFEDINGFTVPTELHSVASARIIGRAVLSIVHRGYQLTTAALPNTSAQTQQVASQNSQPQNSQSQSQ